MRTWRSIAVGLSALALAAAGMGSATAEPPAGQDTRRQAEQNDASSSREPAGSRTYRLLLPTGDVALLTKLPDGRQSATLERSRTGDPAPESGDRGYFVGEYDGDVHLVPAEAMPYLTSGVLDERLFNLTELVEQGFAGRQLPLLLTGPGSETGRRAAATPRTPAGVEHRLTLSSIGAVAVTPTDAHEFWESIDDDRPRAKTRKLSAGVGKVWLDGRVKPSLEDSVRQIGAPKAWKAGYDGDGVKVAVLDSGYDPKHPDLAGRVVDAESFVPGGSVVDGHGHGTHVASTVAGSGKASNGKRKGVAPGADLLVGKVLADNGSGLDSWVIAGMEWAAAQGADVVNMSLGGAFSDGNDPISQALNRISEESGTLFVVAAGNAGVVGDGSVLAPGAADAALTVGAVDDEGVLADFSSRGPRPGDGAMKPEVTAPGVGIIAARAAGTNLGRDVSDSYTSMGGTSMAAPHVAGAAAILAERHPDWTWQQLKAALAASAAPRSGTPASAQGTGLIDVESALRLPVVPDRATVSFGDLSWTDGPPGPVSRDVTYTNVSQRAVTLRLSADVRTPNGVRPDLTVTPSTLRIAPGETAKATVRLDLADTEGGSYSGILTARGAGATVRTGIGFASGGKLHEVTVSGIDRSGNPARAVSGVQLWNTETGDVDAIAFDDNGQRTLHVPTGKYALMVFIMTPDEGGWDQSVALLGKPELTIDRSMTLKFDARDTVPMTIRTPKDSEIDSYIYAWHRKVGDRTALSGWSKNGATEELYVQPFSRVRSGTFDVAIRWDLAQPVLTLHTTGPDGFRVGNPDPRGFAERYEGTEDIPLVDGGDGSVEELERAGAADEIALVRVRFDGGMPDGLTEQLRAAEKVGVKILLLYRDEPGWWSAGEETSVPVYLLEKPEAQPLLDRLADGPVTVRTHGVAQPTYRYDLVFTEDAVRKPVRYDVDARSLAAVTTTYKEHDPGRELSHRESRSAYLDGVDIGFPSTRPVFAPLTRTDYVNTRTAEGPVTWGEDAYADLWNWAGREYSLPRTYRSGQRVDQEWWPAISRPAVLDAEGNEEDGIPVARFEDAIRAAIPQFVSGDGDIYGWGQSYDRTTMTLRRNGKSLGEFDWSIGQWPVPPAPADYELDLTVERSDRAWAATSTRTHTVWSFRSGHVSGRAVLPLLQAEYRLDSDRSNHVASGGPVRLSLVPDYQPGARGPGRIRTTVEVSYDGGATWTTAPVEAGPRGVVDVRVPAAPEGGEAADLRVTLKDRAGNAMVQTIDKAWLLK